MSNKITGELIRVGDMEVGGEKLTGYFVAADIEEIRAVERLPMYRRVEITVADQQQTP